MSKPKQREIIINMEHSPAQKEGFILRYQIAIPFPLGGTIILLIAILLSLFWSLNTGLYQLLLLIYVPYITYVLIGVFNWRNSSKTLRGKIGRIIHEAAEQSLKAS
ncbi:MAG: hypothetical protein QXR97_02580 [Thermoproteota archaeon]